MVKEFLLKIHKQSFYKKFPVWKTITIGRSADEYRQDLNTAGVIISERVDKLLGRPEFFSGEKKNIDLFLIWPSELGVVAPQWGLVVDYHTICSAAFKLGLKLCPLEVVLALRLAYMDQPEYNSELRYAGADIPQLRPLNVATEYFDRGIFSVAHYKGEWRNNEYEKSRLSIDDDSVFFEFAPDDRLVFMKPR